MSERLGFDLDAVESAIIVVKRRGVFHWYRSDRELWILDFEKRRKEFLDAGFQFPQLGETERFGIHVVNEETADRFLANMHPFEIPKDQLAQEFIARATNAQSWWDVCDLIPIMFVDFDNKHVCAFYPKGIPMERYVPNGWTSEFEDFALKYTDELFPKRERYWIQGDVDMLKELIARGDNATGKQD